MQEQQRLCRAHVHSKYLPVQAQTIVQLGKGRCLSGLRMFIILQRRIDDHDGKSIAIARSTLGESLWCIQSLLNVTSNLFETLDNFRERWCGITVKTHI